MTPPCYTFPAAELPERVQLNVHGRQRKMPLPPAPASAATPETSANGDALPAEPSSSNRHRGIDLTRDCALLSSMVQYSCTVAHPQMRDSPIRCWPVQRMFRRCHDRHGSFMVETTAWEGTESANQSGGGGQSSSSAAPATSGGMASSGAAASEASASSVAAPGLPQRPQTMRVFL